MATVASSRGLHDMIQRKLAERIAEIKTRCIEEALQKIQNEMVVAATDITIEIERYYSVQSLEDHVTVSLRLPYSLKE